MDTIFLEESDILAALGLLFAADIKNCKEMLVSVRESDIKKAYRQKALQTHPDRFAAFGENYRKLCSDRFIEVNNAYEILNTYLKQPKSAVFDIRQRDPGPKASPVWRQESRWRQRQSADRTQQYARGFYTNSFRQKDVPGRYLRFAEFLYYSGVITWKVFIKALVWQSKQRLRIGEIAQKWNWLTENQILSLLGQRRPGERLGDILLYHEMISPFQLSMLLCQQRKSQRPIGEYFIEQRFLTQGQIRDILLRQERHNLEYFSGRRTYPNS